jgi:hypothetical protein
MAGIELHSDFVGRARATVTKRGGTTRRKERIALLGSGDTGQYISIKRVKARSLDHLRLRWSEHTGERHWVKLHLAGHSGKRVYVSIKSLVNRTPFTRDQILAARRNRRGVTQLLADYQAERARQFGETVESVQPYDSLARELGDSFSPEQIAEICSNDPPIEYRVHTSDAGQVVVEGELRGQGAFISAREALEIKRPNSLKARRRALITVREGHREFLKQNALAEEYAACRYIVAPARDLGVGDLWLTTLYDFDGQNLPEELSREALLAAVTDVARGLERLQRDGRVHQDVKPENFLFIREGDELQGVIGDLGFVGEEGKRIGWTRAFIEPGHPWADKPADIWAFGKSLSEMFPKDDDVADLVDQMQAPIDERLTIRQVIKHLKAMQS